MTRPAAFRGGGVPVRSGMLVHSGMLVRSGMLGRAPQGARRLTRAAAAALVLLGPTLAGCRSGGAPAPAVGETPPDELVVSAPCVPSGPELCFNGVDDNCNGLLEEGCGIPSGLVQFVAAWSEPDVDVDLHVTDPNGEVAEVGHVTAGGLTKQHDCPGKQNLCYGQNFENVYLDGDDATPGIYRVRLRLDALGSAQPPVVVRIAARIGGASYNSMVRLQHEEDERTLRYFLGEVSDTVDLGVGSAERGSGTR